MARYSGDETYLDCQSGLADTTIAKNGYSPVIHSAGAVRGILGSGRDVQTSEGSEGGVRENREREVVVDDRGEVVKEPCRGIYGGQRNLVRS